MEFLDYTDGVIEYGLPLRRDAAMDAVRKRCPDLIDDGHEPWQGVRWLAMVGSPSPTHAVDIGATMDRAVASLREHRAYLAGLGDAAGDPDQFLRENARHMGARFGGRLACDFELIAR